MNEELVSTIQDLKESIDRLTAIQTDHFNVDTSTDDTMSLKNKIEELMLSNKQLRDSIYGLNAAINNLSENIISLRNR